MPLNETILWPSVIDTFASMSANVGGSVADDQIMFAQYPNKIAKALERMQSLWTGTTVGSGNLTIRALGTPNTLFVGVHDLWQLVAAEYAANPGLTFPGNVLPFEFVYTRTTDNYTSWAINGHYLAYQVGDPVFTMEANSGLDFDVYKPMASAGTFDFTSYSNPAQALLSSLIVQAHAVQQDDTVLVRGIIIDPEAAHVGERWERFSDRYLYCTINGLQT